MYVCILFDRNNETAYNNKLKVELSYGMVLVAIGRQTFDAKMCCKFFSKNSVNDKFKLLKQ